MPFQRLGFFEMTDLGVGHGRLAIEHQAERLHRLDRQRLMRFDERAVVREIVHADRVSGVETSPEGSEHFESDPDSAIARRAHHKGHPFILAIACAIEPPQICYAFPRKLWPRT